ncbi:2-succinyl-5-enolpyruvyl-6-hydroxy-3-cyclohexene-1-carboxylic-acid synthase [Neochlamydia sp. AcF95]|uniref:2-succinyl-5-enolpyruvyl-6-hydroxy-3- cyclohexene-1-carboxylic-acid synthase n=1 Tax=Neochlamydia sp. AcF95 TaxID=2795734 RepID=UPI001BCA4CD7|nr:2-succinyl-5-enolpyruvyl-6-hydroxy-3-cyclohexene-1-carboxylic-acid synthase [Neochlamydia sp. AcF95]MBS4171021.1 2-succinyl-5-enolpyruvyl-6-hydroxy-3- cyclohexene-1-carboxylate synthase [Neochlamydia sp. AcF95]
MNMNILFTKDNEELVIQILQELLYRGVKEICVCPGGRNVPFITALEKTGRFKLYYWPEERSAAFFALGRSKRMHRPTVVLTTSGTAAGELLPAAMEAYYTGLPLILLTADRPRRLRGTGSPQAAEQVGLFGHYAVFEQDIAAGELCTLQKWKQNGPAHINVCLEEPLNQNFNAWKELDNKCIPVTPQKGDMEAAKAALDQFIQTNRYPFIVVGALSSQARQAIVKFLSNYQAPVYLEATSGLRENPSLLAQSITRSENIWRAAENAGYPIDGILRIGGIPTFRLWRDLEELKGRINVCSISELPFTGLSWGSNCLVPLHDFFSIYRYSYTINKSCSAWLKEDQRYQSKLLTLLQEEPQAEASLIYHLSKQIPSSSLIYLGNSLPIREWDAYATREEKHENIFANRGLNGIDGQLSTFLGMSSYSQQNWGIMGDLTTLYDLAAPWILEQLKEIDLNLIVINNSGGKIFASMYANKQIQNQHHLRFRSFADMWNMRYVHYTHLPEAISYGGHQLVEIMPDETATMRFWNCIESL